MRLNKPRVSSQRDLKQFALDNIAERLLGKFRQLSLTERGDYHVWISLSTEHTSLVP